MELLETLNEQLKKEPNFVTDNGELKKWVVINKAQNLDEELISLLLENETIKEYFFKEIKKDVWVFNQASFIQFMEHKNFLNDSYTKYKNKVGLTIGGKYLKQRNEVALVWPFKDCILEGGQSTEEQKREEIFFNEILAQDEITQILEPKVLTNAKRIDKDGEKLLDKFNRNENGTITDNLIIKGNNLLALHTLKKEFTGKVKLIYIDPPYNTQSVANTFTYNNKFNHSSWLTFVKNRSDIARNLLTDNGLFCCAIDHNELFYLGVLLDEIFGRDNRIGIVSVETNPGGRSDSKFLSTSSEYFILYAKNIELANLYDIEKEQKKLLQYNKEDAVSKYKLVPLRRTGSNSTPDKRKNLCYPIYYNTYSKEISVEKPNNINEWVEIMPMGTDIMRVWRWSKEKVMKSISEIEVVSSSKDKYDIYVKDRIRTKEKAKTLWYGSKYDASASGTKILQKLQLSNIFSYPKSVFLMKDIIDMTTQENDIVLDFHLGSGTTAAVAHKMNRQYIGIEQMDYIETIAVERLKKVIEGEQGGISKAMNWQGGGEFVYFELKKYNQTFIEQIEDAKDSETLLQIWEQMKEHSFLNYNVDIKKQDKNIEEFKKLNIKEQKQHLCEILDKNQLYVNLSSLNDSDFACTDEEKQVTKDFYRI